MDGLLVFHQGSGRLCHVDAQGDHHLLATGYAGYRSAANQPSRQAERGIGPIPRGIWRVGVPFHHARLGPLAFPLSAKEGTETFGRSAFYIHGDNAKGDRSGSYGCIVVPRPARERIRALMVECRSVSLKVTL